MSPIDVRSSCGDPVGVRLQVGEAERVGGEVERTGAGLDEPAQAVAQPVVQADIGENFASRFNSLSGSNADLSQSSRKIVSYIVPIY